MLKKSRENSLDWHSFSICECWSPDRKLAKALYCNQVPFNFAQILSSTLNFYFNISYFIQFIISYTNLWFKLSIKLYLDSFRLILFNLIERDRECKSVLVRNINQVNDTNFCGPLSLPQALSHSGDPSAYLPPSVPAHYSS